MFFYFPFFAEANASLYIKTKQKQTENQSFFPPNRCQVVVLFVPVSLKESMTGPFNGLSQRFRGHTWTQTDMLPAQTVYSMQAHLLHLELDYFI